MRLDDLLLNVVFGVIGRLVPDVPLVRQRGLDLVAANKCLSNATVAAFGEILIVRLTRPLLRFISFPSTLRLTSARIKAPPISQSAFSTLPLNKTSNMTMMIGLNFMLK